jgi:signal peptidase II
LLQDITTTSSINRIIGFEISKNFGFAFGLPLPMPIIFIVTIVVLGLISWYFILSLPFTAKENLLAYGFGLILGGGAANFFERVTHGFVTDYVRISLDGLSGTWNAADIGIIVGMVLWIIAARKENTNMYQTSHTLEI